MSEQPIESYLTLDFFKKMIGSKTTQKDDFYLQIINDANAKVQTALFRYVDTPIDVGSIYHPRIRNIALSWARSLHAINIQLIEKSKIYIEQFNMQLYGAEGTEGKPMAGGLIQELIATRNNRTRTILARFDPREQKIPLPTQNDLFVSQRFG